MVPNEIIDKLSILNDLVTRMDKLEERQEKLEQNHNQVLSLLVKIEHRLAGTIDSDKPGLIDEIRTMRKVLELVEKRMGELEKSNVVARITNLESDLSKTKEELNTLARYKAMLYGGLVVGAFIIERVWEYVIGFVHKKP